MNRPNQSDGEERMVSSDQTRSSIYRRAIAKAIVRRLGWIGGCDREGDQACPWSCESFAAAAAQLEGARSARLTTPKVPRQHR